MKLQNKTVFITGGAKRIGREICKYFFNNGANIALHCNNSIQKAEELKDEFGDKCHVFQSDLTNTTHSIEIFKEAILKFGKIEFLINNASVFEQNLICNITEENFDRDFAVHLKTPLFLMQEFAKQNFAEEEGLIVNLLDKNIARQNTSFISYLLSKKSLDELTRFAAFELAPNIRVNSISPGFIIPEEGILTQNINQYIENKTKNIPLKRKGEAKDIVQTLDFIVNTSYVNGVNIQVDGGSFTC